MRAGLNLADAAELLGLYGAPTLSKIENGKQRPDLERFLSAYGIDDPAEIAETRKIAEIASTSRQQSLFAQYKDAIRPRFADFIELEQLAVGTDAYAALAVPGLLQTPEYAFAIIGGSNTWQTSREVRAFTSLRMKRQELLTSDQFTLRCVLDEACLRREVGGPAILRGQLEHLMSLSHQANIELQVIPFKAGTHSGVDGAYTLFRFEVGDPVVAVEPLTASLYVEKDDQVARYAAAWDRLRAQALDPESSRDFIARIAKETR